MSNIFATFAAAKDHMCLSSNTKSGAKVQQKIQICKLKPFFILLFAGFCESSFGGMPEASGVRSTTKK